MSLSIGRELNSVLYCCDQVYLYIREVEIERQNLGSPLNVGFMLIYEIS